MTLPPAYLKLAWSRPAFLAYGAAAALLLASLLGYVRDERSRTDEARAPVVATPTDRAEDWKFKPVETTILEPVVPKKDAQKLAKRFNRPDLAPVALEPIAAPGAPAAQPAPAILRNDEDKRPMPGGVEVLTVLEPDGSVTNTLLPRPAPLFPRKVVWYAEALTDEWKAPDGLDDLYLRAGAEFRAVALMRGRLELRPKVEVYREPLPLLGGVEVDPDTGLRYGVRFTWE